jgi:hypothetical protein
MTFMPSRFPFTAFRGSEKKSYFASKPTERYGNTSTVPHTAGRFAGPRVIQSHSHQRRWFPVSITGMARLSPSLSDTVPTLFSFLREFISFWGSETGVTSTHNREVAGSNPARTERSASSVVRALSAKGGSPRLVSPVTFLPKSIPASTHKNHAAVRPELLRSSSVE